MYMMSELRPVHKELLLTYLRLALRLAGNTDFWLRASREMK